MKKLLATDVDGVVPSKYFECLVEDKVITQSGHLCFRVVDVKEIVVVDGVKVVGTCYPSGNYVVPKRRLELFELAKREVRYKGVYVFKVQQEKFSEKWMVSQIFEGVGQE